MNVPLFERHNWRSSLGAKYFKRPGKASVLNEATGNAIVQAKNKMALRFIVLSNASGKHQPYHRAFPRTAASALIISVLIMRVSRPWILGAILAGGEQRDPHRLVTLPLRLQLGDVRHGSKVDFSSHRRDVRYC